MRDHNESHESPPHRDRANRPSPRSQWGGDEDPGGDEAHPCGAPGVAPTVD